MRPLCVPSPCVCVTSGLTSLRTHGRAGKEILVPLTQSLYVPGKVKEADKVLIDVGR